MKALHLTLKKKWFDMIASGEKKEEYREIKPYWASRLTWHEFHCCISCVESLKDVIQSDSEQRFTTGVFTTKYDTVTFKHGYAKDAPTITLKCNGITYGPAKPEWSDNWQGDVFIIKLGDILNNHYK